MFGLLKKKLADWLGNSSKKDEEKQPEIVAEKSFDKLEVKPVEQSKEVKDSKEQKSSKKFDKKIPSKKSDKLKAEIIDDLEDDMVKPQVVVDVAKEEVVVEEKRSVGFFSRIKSVFSSQKITDDFFDKQFEDLELILLENNVALSVVDSIKASLAGKLLGHEFKKSEVEQKIREALSDTISSLFVDSKIDIIDYIKNSPSTVTIMFCGINGSGKTTTLAKFANLLKENNISCVFAASDTFRAASIEQLMIHARALGVSVVKQTYGSDPAAVAFDAIKYASAKKIKVVLVDTAGRMHTKTNLMDEISKIARVAKPDFKIFVGESITGNDATEQARIFNDAVNIDGIILTKADIDEKGGTAISVSKVTGKPILYLGTGQDYNSLEKFDKGKVLSALGL